MILQRSRPIAFGFLLLLGGCHFEQRPPAGPARELAAAQAAVTAYYAALMRRTPGLPGDPALSADSLVLVRSDVQVQRDLGTAWATVRVGRGDGTRLQLLSLHRGAAGWAIERVVTASP